MKLNPQNDWILVRLHEEPEENKVGSLFVPNPNNVLTAEVLRVGPGKPSAHGRIPMDVAPGEIVTFLRWHLEHQQGKQLKPCLEELGAGLALIKQDDILLVVDPLEKVNVEAVLPS